MVDRMAKVWSCHWLQVESALDELQTIVESYQSIHGH